MKSFNVDNIKEFMNELLLNDKYDSFYLFDAKVNAAIDYYVNGKINREFFDKEELDNMTGDEYILWKDVKATIHDYMKGNHLPIKFKIVLMFNRDNIIKLIEMNNILMHPDNVGALFMNIYYENGLLYVTSGISMNIFTMDKTLESIWDETLEKYYI